MIEARAAILTTEPGTCGDVFYIVKVVGTDGVPGHTKGKKLDLWLGESEGYVTLTTMRAGATRFPGPPRPSAISAWQGKPWYFTFDPTTAKVYRITRNLQVTEEEIPWPAAAP